MSLVLIFVSAGNRQQSSICYGRMYQDKLAQLKKQLQQLKDSTLPEYMKKLKKIEQHYKERMWVTEVWFSYGVSSHHDHHWAVVVSRGWAKASACRLQASLSCAAVLFQIVSFQYLSRSVYEIALVRDK